jgi:hypothetical protein
MGSIEDAKNTVKNNIDWKIVVSSVVATVIIGAGVMALKKYGGKAGKTAAAVVAGGK